MNGKTLRDGFIGFVAIALLFGIEAPTMIHAITLGFAVGWVAGGYIGAAMVEILNHRDEKRMAREYATTGPGRPMSDQEIADVHAWLEAKRRESR